MCVFHLIRSQNSLEDVRFCPIQRNVRFSAKNLRRNICVCVEQSKAKPTHGNVRYVRGSKQMCVCVGRFAFDRVALLRGSKIPRTFHGLVNANASRFGTHIAETRTQALHTAPGVCVHSML